MLTLPAVRECLQRILIDAEVREDLQTVGDARLALHHLNAWSEQDLEAAVRAWRRTASLKGLSTPRGVLHALDPSRPADVRSEA